MKQIRTQVATNIVYKASVLMLNRTTGQLRNKMRNELMVPADTFDVWNKTLMLNFIDNNLKIYAILEDN